MGTGWAHNTLHHVFIECFNGLKNAFDLLLQILVVVFDLALKVGDGELILSYLCLVRGYLYLRLGLLALQAIVNARKHLVNGVNTELKFVSKCFDR